MRTTDRTATAAAFDVPTSRREHIHERRRNADASIRSTIDRLSEVST
ncbi:hypothetical protein [Natrialba sp. INN-245]|nr:hypothetical protein [Natrialba sp. INN-245]MWV40766.1 hypothetical protein [Natrialba sp. INN-245]